MDGNVVKKIVATESCSSTVGAGVGRSRRLFARISRAEKIKPRSVTGVTK